MSSDKAIDLGEDVGYVSVRLAGMDDPVRLDLYQTCEQIFTCYRDGGPGTAGVQALMLGLGFPEGVSLAAADRFAAALIERRKEVIDGIKKNASGGPSPGSAASTDPTS